MLFNLFPLKKNIISKNYKQHFNKYAYVLGYENTYKKYRGRLCRQLRISVISVLAI